MKKENEISHQAWQGLYEATIAFKDLECWEWMYDSDLFGVQNPETGEVGYCCVLGNLGEVLALNVYQGTEGLESYWRLHDQSEPPEQSTLIDAYALFSVQACLMASFEDRSELHNRDRAQIRELGLKFRGKKEWPMFRSYLPGYQPWFLTPEEVQVLAVALQQAVEVGSVFRDHPDWLVPPDRNEGRYLVRVLEDGKWIDTWQQPAEYETPRVEPVFNEVLLARLKGAGLQRKDAWLTDCVLLPMGIQEGERPYYPYGFIVLGSEGAVLSMELLKPDAVENEVPDKFMGLLEDMECLPQTLLVGSEKTLALLEPVAEKLEISIQYAEEHPMLTFFLSHLGEFLGGAE